MASLSEESPEESACRVRVWRAFGPWANARIRRWWARSRPEREIASFNQEATEITRFAVTGRRLTQSDANHSPPSSLLNRELTGNICVFGANRSPERSRSAVSSKAFSANSLLNGTGNFNQQTGNSFSISGNFQGEAGNLFEAAVLAVVQRFESAKRRAPGRLEKGLVTDGAERKRLPSKSSESGTAKVGSKERNAETSVSLRPTVTSLAVASRSRPRFVGRPRSSPS